VAESTPATITIDGVFTPDDIMAVLKTLQRMQAGLAGSPLPTDAQTVALARDLALWVDVEPDQLQQTDGETVMDVTSGAELVDLYSHDIDVLRAITALVREAVSRAVLVHGPPPGVH
jgi:hypothetical protein